MLKAYKISKFDSVFYKLLYYIVSSNQYKFLYRSSVEKSAACGFETGMTIVINSDPNDYYATLIGAYGVKVIQFFPYLSIYLSIYYLT